jgi:general secretion pathway protein M
MKDWFYSLQPRERLMVTGCAAVIMLALVYSLIWAPIAERRAQLAINVEAQREVLAWMRQASRQVQEARRNNPIATVNDTRSLLSIVDSSATQAGVRNSIQRMEPEGDRGVKLSMENADFDATIQWLGALKRSHNVDVVSATISPNDTPGQVDTHLSLQRP